MAAEHGVADRLDLIAGDMFADPVPPGADAILLSNVLHDWDVPDCRTLVARCAAALPPGGRLLVHDVFLTTPWTARCRSPSTRPRCSA